MLSTKSNTQNSTQHAEQQDAADIQNELFLFFNVFIFYSYLNLLKYFSKNVE